MAELSERQREVLDFVRRKPGYTSLGISKHLYGRNPGRGGSVTATLNALARRGLVVREQGWWLPVEGETRGNP